jgi:hypothetical protein
MITTTCLILWIPAPITSPPAWGARGGVFAKAEGVDAALHVHNSAATTAPRTSGTLPDVTGGTVHARRRKVKQRVTVPRYHPLAVSISVQRTRRREQRENTRREILAAAQAFLRDHPYRELSIDVLMADTGLTRTSFYRHFDDITELVL